MCLLTPNHHSIQYLHSRITTISPTATALQGNSSITSGTAAAPNTATFMARNNDNGIPVTKTKQCHECRANPALYQCPRCSFRSCSLPCCQAHKRRTQCNGRRDKTQFLKMSQMNDATLKSDYLFLEEIVGRVDAGKRLLRSAGAAAGGGRNNNHSNSHHHKRQRREGGGGGEEADTAAAAEDETPPPHTLLQAASSSSIIGKESITTKGIARILPQQNHHPTPQQLPPKWRTFQRLAASRWTTVLFMPTGMARHQQNKSFVKKNTLHWTIEWRWHGGDDDDDRADANGKDKSEKQQSPPQTQTTTVSETSVVGDVLRSLRWAATQDDASSSSSNVSILRKRLPGRSDQPKYVEIAPTATVREALQHATVYEFPTLDLVPHSNNRRLLADFPRLIADVEVATTSTVVNEGQDEPQKNSDS